jgi:hypothetical protein
MEPEDLDYADIWRWIIANAERHVQEQEWQARWFDEAARRLSPAEAYAAERRASKAFIRHTIQQLDLATAINQGDIADYIERWYPQAQRSGRPGTSPPNGPRVTFVSVSEWSLDLAAKISEGEYEALFGGTICCYDESDDNSPAIWRKYLARRRARREHQASPPYVNHVPTGNVRPGGVGPRPCLRSWARRVLRRR